MLLNFKGNAHKNKAVVYRTSGIRGDADKELENAEKAFKKVLDDQKTDPSALKGMGDVSLARGDLRSARKYVDEAIRVEPNFRAAKRERDRINRLEIQKPKK
jgi:tetratricopeptide (TPR) repeat protein